MNFKERRIEKRKRKKTINLNLVKEANKKNYCHDC